ncbi:MAG: PaaI family thioesterase [Hyphomicrobiales bacterium]
MKKLKNPYESLEGYNCFGCSGNNEHGLQMKFKFDGEEVVSEWEPRGYFQGYFNTLHGGIQSTLIDEIACWLVQMKCKTAGLTSNLNVRYLKSVSTLEGKIKLVARLKGMRRNLADVEVELLDSKGVKCSEGKVTYFTFPEKVAKDKLHFPEYEDFFCDK